MIWPDVDRDQRTVGSVVDRRHQAVARILLPLHGHMEGALAWEDVAAAAQLDLNAETTFAQLAETEQGRSCGLESPYGVVDEAVIEQLVPLLAAQTAGNDVYAVIANVYSDDRPQGIDGVRIPWSDGRTRWHSGYEKLALIDLHDLALFSAEQDQRFPVAVFPNDLSFVLGCDIYSDSLIISGGSQLLDGLAETTLEWFTTERGAPLPLEYLP